MRADARRLSVRVRRQGGTVEAVVTPPAALPVGALLLGRPAGEVARLVPLVFNVCASAQEAATRSALGRALPDMLAARVAAETLREHAVKLCLVWPATLGIEPDREALSLARRAMAEPEVARALARALFAPLDTAPGTLAELETWMAAGRGVPARAFRVVARDWDPGWGAADLPAFDPARPVDWAGATQGGRAVDDGPATRHAGARLLDEIAMRHGRGCLWRMAVRLVEAAAILDGRAPAPLAGPGMANAARGVMLVAATTDADGVVTGFERLSPTDFHLAEGGVMASALACLPVERDAPLDAVARLTVETVDPCLPVAVEVTCA